jgi:linoleoyl-CoA desaturase
VRSSPAADYKWYHRYQLYYAPFLYLFHSLYLIYIKDFEDLHLVHTKVYSLPVKQHPLWAYGVTVFSKLFYLFYSLILPILLLDMAWWKVLAGYLAIHFVMGTLLTVVLVPVHLVQGNLFPEKGPEGRIHNSWVRHVFETTIDYSSGSRWANFFFGGLNTHLAHHLFPGVCHVHLREVTQLIRNRAREYGMPYKELTMARALQAHFTLLSQLSRP